MTEATWPVAGETLAEAAMRIREAAPIRGDQATDGECRLRRQLIDDTLAVRGVARGPHVWHTAQLVDGRVTGVWGNSVQEAELGITVWHGAACHWIVPDPGCRLWEEYFTPGRRASIPADRRFPVGPPRHIRDQFAPASSLLDLHGATTADTGVCRG